MDRIVSFCTTCFNLDIQSVAKHWKSGFLQPDDIYLIQMEFEDRENFLLPANDFVRDHMAKMYGFVSTMMVREMKWLSCVELG